MGQRRNRHYLSWSLDETDGIHYIEPPELILGSRSDCDLVLRHAALSGRHARFTREENETYVEDLRSAHGTSVNGHALTPYQRHPIAVNDVITAGKLSLTVHLQTSLPADPVQKGIDRIDPAPSRAKALEQKLDRFRKRLERHTRNVEEDKAGGQELKTAIEADLKPLADFVTHRFNEYRTLQKVIKKLNDIAPVPALLGSALSLIRQVIESERGFFVLHHAGHGAPLALIAQGYEGSPPGDESDFGVGLARNAHQTRETLIVADTSHCEEHDAPESGPRSAICMPFEQGDHIRGALYLDHGQPNHFRADQTGFLDACTRQVAMALENVRLYTQSVTDSLTRLYNRKYVEERIAEEMVRAHRYQRDCSLLLFDIDFFKNVNDTYGHDVGDRVLRNTANQLRAAVRSTDIVARYGGEEFLLLLTETKLRGALSFAERLRKAVEVTTIEVDGHQIKITISCGVATYRLDYGNKLATFVKKADEALYRAKQEGRNQVCHASED